MTIDKSVRSATAAELAAGGFKHHAHVVGALTLCSIDNDIVMNACARTIVP